MKPVAPWILGGQVEISPAIQNAGVDPATKNTKLHENERVGNREALTV